ncbi:hypothetical protein CYA_1610 [Synechococcus sp. JA-3-3Ab]|nr:hypothetical protein CYA_1610 [Synechococcus sp. JA-3-3Ab]
MLIKNIDFRPGLNGDIILLSRGIPSLGRPRRFCMIDFVQERWGLGLELAALPA